MCYILDPMRADVSRWVAMGVSTVRLCARIHKANGETCTLFHAARLGRAAADDARPRTTPARGVVYE